MATVRDVAFAENNMERSIVDKQMIETIATLVEAVSDIKTNHLVHIQSHLEKIDDRMWQGGSAIVGVLTGILITLLLK